MSTVPVKKIVNRFLFDVILEGITRCNCMCIKRRNTGTTQFHYLLHSLRKMICALIPSQKARTRRSYKCTIFITSIKLPPSSTNQGALDSTSIHPKFLHLTTTATHNSRRKGRESIYAKRSEIQKGTAKISNFHPNTNVKTNCKLFTWSTPLPGCWSALPRGHDHPYPWRWRQRACGPRTWHVSPHR